MKLICGIPKRRQGASRPAVAAFAALALAGILIAVCAGLIGPGDASFPGPGGAGDAALLLVPPWTVYVLTFQP
jgi:hypothetical protein